jgi:NADPH2:quinone reductase
VQGSRVTLLEFLLEEQPMPRAIRIQEVGGPEVMRLEEVDVPVPAAGNVQLKHTAIGLNYIDVYDRNGLYPQNLPGGLGREAAGIVIAVGDRVKGIRVGDRVAYVLRVPGAYCDVRNVPADRLVKIPAGISDEQAAVLVAQGHDRVLPAAPLLPRQTR